MYICRRAEPDLMDMNLANDGLPTNGGDQWWRINYAPVGSSPVTVEVCFDTAPGYATMLTDVENYGRKGPGSC